MKIAFVTVLEDEVDIVGSLFDVDESDYIIVFAAAEDLNFVLE